MEEEFSIVNVEEFISYYLPFEPTEDSVDKMVQSLSDAKMSVLVEVDGKLRFRDFWVPSCRAAGTETALPLDTISGAIASGPVEGRKRNKFNFRGCPNTVIESQIAGSDNKVDGCFTSEDPKSKTLDTSRLACILEYKLNSLQEVENNKQALSASVQIMNDDVRRMFTYGITIIQDHVTLWYHSRSHSMISEPFSFVENPRLLIKVFMSFLFATEEELGYDPMVTRDAKGDYIYRIPSTEQGQQRDRFFRTTASIEYRSNNITGRMARVWKVAECKPSGAVLSPSGPSRVLKDVWLEDSALTEAQIQSQIFEDIQKFFRDKQDARYLAFERLRPSISDLERNDRYKNYFIQIVTDYEGRRTKPRSPNSERKRRLFSTLKPIALPTTSNRGGSGTPRPTESKITFDEGPREFVPRKQYRVIFGEVCEAVGDLGTVGEVADVLSQAIVALRLMYCAGWVHRDISSGNILAHRRSSSSPWQAKLSDLEYSRRFSPNSDREVAIDPKTGTPYFMPHEILSSRYIVPRQPSTQTPELVDDDFRDGSAPQPPEPPPVYNFQHDLESIWWIFVWTVTCRVSHEPSVAFGRTIFRTLMEPPLARLKFLEDTITQQFMGCLLSPLQQLAGPLEVLRRFIYDAYLYHQTANDLADLTSYIAAHRGFVIFFEKVKQSQATWGNIALVTCHRPVATITSVPSAANISKPTRLKRPCDDDAYVADAEGQTKSRRSKRSSGKT